MTYTFDEALKQLRELSQKGADTWYGDQLEKRTNVKGHLEAGEVGVIINKLREEYAPTVEMTESGKNALLMSLEDEEFETFFDFIEYGDYQYRGEVSIDDLMRAWLHPETIKVVDE